MKISAQENEDQYWATNSAIPLFSSTLALHLCYGLPNAFFLEEKVYEYWMINKNVQCNKFYKNYF